jgi:hypothetical protein
VQQKTRARDERERKDEEAQEEATGRGHTTLDQKQQEGSRKRAEPSLDLPWYVAVRLVYLEDPKSNDGLNQKISRPISWSWRIARSRDKRNHES